MTRSSNGIPNAQATTESATSGTFADNDNGTYTYEFSQALTDYAGGPTFDGNKIHRIGVEIRTNRGGFLPENIPANNAPYDFVPNGGSPVFSFSADPADSTVGLRPLELFVTEGLGGLLARAEAGLLTVFLQGPSLLQPVIESLARENGVGDRVEVVCADARRLELPREFDVVVIGSGTGAAIVDAALYQGMRVALIDRGPLGGTCLNVGCITSKALLHASELVHESRHTFGKMGISVGEVSVDVAKMLDYKNGVIKSNTDGIEFLFKKNGVELFEGRGRIAAPGAVEVTPAEGEPYTVEAAAVVVATGATEKKPERFITCLRQPAGGERVIHTVASGRISGPI